MKLPSALILAVFFIASPLLAQTSSRDMKGGIGQPQRPAQHEPGTPATPAQATAESKPENVDPAKDAAIRHLLDITQESKMGERVGEFVTGQVQEGMSRSLPPDRLQKFMEVFSQKFNQSAPASAITGATVVIYAKHFSQEDIQALVKFYESPVGQRVVKAIPEISKELQSEAIEMDRKAMMAILRDMSNEYTELKRLLPPDASDPPAAPTPAPTPTPKPAPGATAAPKPATPPEPTPAPPQQ